MRITVIIILHLILGQSLHGQMQFRYAGQQLTLINSWLIPGVFHNEPLSVTDSEPVRVFKEYFHPASYEAFKAMTLIEEWGGMTPLRFAEWQEKLKENPLELTFAMHLKNAQGLEFLVLQYTVHQSHYLFASTKALKLVHQRWMHRNLDKSAETQILERIGMMKKEFLLQQIADQTPVVSLGAEVESQVRVHEEKFNRQDLEDEITLALKKFEYSEADISTALTLLYDKDRNAMITYLLAARSVDRYQLLEEINKQVGFEYYKYFLYQSKVQK